MKRPLVSVVMPVRLTTVESESYFREALNSILAQTYADFELVIIDDSPPEMSLRVAETQGMDERILLRRGDNSGIADALNMGCHIAKGKYVARMDSDDVSSPVRFERQVDFLERHPDIKVLGAWSRLIDSNGRPGQTIRNPTSHALIAWSLTFGNCMTNSTVMLRRDFLEELGFYRREILFEDYDMWARASLVAKLGNLPEVLGYYRVYPRSHTATIATTLQEQGVFHIMDSRTRSLIPRYASVERTTILLKLSKLDGMSMDEIEEALGLMALLENALVSTLGLTGEEVRRITCDEEQRILLVAAVVARRSVSEGIRVVVQSRRLLPRTFRGPVPLLSRDTVYNLLNHDFGWWRKRLGGG